MDDKIHDDPSTVVAAKGQVLVDGPDGVSVSLTPEAAAETSDRLLQAAAQAQGQLIERRRREEEARDIRGD